MKQSVSSDSAPESAERLRRQRDHIDRGIAARREAQLDRLAKRDAELAAIIDAAVAHPGRGFARLRAAVEQVRTALAFSAVPSTAAQGSQYCDAVIDHATSPTEET